MTPRSPMVAIAGVFVVAAVATAGDFIWYENRVQHRALHGVLHGAALLTAVGGALGAAAGRLVAGLPLGTFAGIAGALAYYGLRPVTGSTGAMIAAWAALWLIIAWLDGRIVRRPPRALAEIAMRGVIAVVAGALAFWAMVDTLWGSPPPGGRNYLVQFGAWLLAWAPGMLAIAWPRGSGAIHS